jgi:hypothetical protein
MTKDEYDRMLKDVQEIEAQTGLQILTPFQHIDDDGMIHSAGWTHNGLTVFRQTRPFTPETTYYVNESAWGRIVYSDPTR